MTERITIGGIAVENPLFLAPLAGVTLSGVRRFFRRLGAGLVHTEMVSGTGLLYGGVKTRRMLDFHDEEHPLVLQLFATDADSLYRSAELALHGHSYDGFSVNMACPMPKITKRGAGSALLRTPQTACEMVRGLKRFGLPVWPKIRKVVPDATYTQNTEQFAGELLAAGADNVAVHGRTPAQRYEGVADAGEILRVARAFPGMIMASGDVYTPEKVKFYLDGGCSAVLVARGAIADPLLIPRTLGLLGYAPRDTVSELTLRRRAELLVEFADILRGAHAERIALMLLKRFVPGFFRGRAGMTEFKRTLAQTKDWDSTYRLLLDWRSYFERGNA